MNKQHLKTIRDLKKNDDLIITRPDKGSGVVLLNRKDYIAKMGDILSDTTKFMKIGSVENHDRTLQQERALQAFLLRAQKSKDLPKAVYDRIRPVGATRPRMYGVPKIHKKDNPLRPILSMINAPQHAMAKWLTEVLQPVVSKFSTHTIKDAFEFCEIIEEFGREKDFSSEGSFMCSFDVVSLYTNIPLEETIDICLNTLYRDESIKKPSIPETLLRKLLLKATTEVEFSFDNMMYRQVDGVAMGSPLGPILANIFVGFYESKIKDEDMPLLYHRYVDDTYSIFENTRASDDFLNILNNLHPALKFTAETEKDNKLPYLEVLVQRIDGKVVRSVYRKPTFSGLYTRWDSFVPTTQKIGLIKSLASRAFKICSKCTIKEELSRLKAIFTKNGYPTAVVQRAIDETAEKHQKLESSNGGSSVATEDTSLTNVCLRLPWLGKVSNHYRSKLTKTVKSSFPKAQLRVVFTSRTAFNGRTKDVLPIGSKSNIIYQYTCSCGLSYIGRTTQCFDERIKQHIPTSLLQDRPLLQKKTADSAITRHLKSNQACIPRDTPASRFGIVATARNSEQLKVLEALFIKKLAPPLCNQKEHTHNLSLF